MGYKVIRNFLDTSDRMPEHLYGYAYQIGDSYPRSGYKPEPKFLQSLLDGTNTTGSIFLVFDERDLESFSQEKQEDTEPKKKRTRQVKAKEPIEEENG